MARSRMLLCLTGPQYEAAVAEAVRAVCASCSEASSALRVAIVGSGCHSDVDWRSASEWLEAEWQAEVGVATDARDAVATVARLILRVPTGSRLELIWAEGGDPAADTEGMLGLAAYTAVKLAADRDISVECTLTEWAMAGCEAVSTPPAEGRAPLSAWTEVCAAPHPPRLLHRAPWQ